ncbi:aminotransferase class I/II-fold pyridoxal phosphate-dependent enzyme [Leisingera aquimarina]|uniref:aminotransferase class I/II-fold pyridoxal phosphate-dependent enzyme n=1 Tax=Leisingera aquimarina TaxID=476529 RepID=UPI002480E488|nr:aminotransferase class I/II-fold pyridoxal phosphate-dependent enzyme [Leisingera aquimarina]
MARSGASHAPDHGPAIVRTILKDVDMKALWLRDLDQMRQRVARMREQIVAIEQDMFGTHRLAYLGRQVGMFSLLPLSVAQEIALPQDHGIHVVEGGRINVAHLGDEDVRWLVDAVCRIMSRPSR